MILLLNSDAREIPLAKESVHCVFTSPPYWGQRIYATARWAGGDPNCDHEAARKKTRFDYPLNEKQGSNKGSDLRIYKAECPTCGANQVDGQLGSESTPDEYVKQMVNVFREIRRVLRPDGVVWLNLGDSYATHHGSGKGYDHNFRDPLLSEEIGHTFNRPYGSSIGLKEKDLVGIPWMVAFALREDGWYLRRDNIWFKPNPMPESAKDRPGTTHEYIFQLTKSRQYFYDNEAVKVPAKFDGRKDTFYKGASKYKAKPEHSFQARKHPRWQETDGQLLRELRSVWTVPTRGYKGAHYATFPAELVEMGLKAGISEFGCCSSCGSQWARIIKVGERERHNSEPQTVNSGRGKKADRTKHAPPPVRESAGWQPTCSCYDAKLSDICPLPRSARKAYQRLASGDWILRARRQAYRYEVDLSRPVVLDPFVGSGTTLIAARQLGAHGIGLDLSIQYLAADAQKRLELDRAKNWKNLKANSVELSDLTELPLFSMEVE